ncbi:uncharacterized protein LOC133711563 [Rosa rugosa]|uniref:uncharacterized protein LOC133711563 n=1 Tax=Rosa rugosa TaxID=74645 RepID=UPI002B415EB5|nr:uncharacterized protein LOC133711563 [Rosa rugosa]
MTLEAGKYFSKKAFLIVSHEVMRPARSSYSQSLALSAKENGNALILRRFSSAPCGCMFAHTDWNSLMCLLASSILRPWNIGSLCNSPLFSSNSACLPAAGAGYMMPEGGGGEGERGGVICGDGKLGKIKGEGESGGDGVGVGDVDSSEGFKTLFPCSLNVYGLNCKEEEISLPIDKAKLPSAFHLCKPDLIHVSQLFIHYGLRFFCSRYNGAEGLHTKVTEFVRDKDCVVCGPGVLIELDTSVTLRKVQSRNVKSEFKLAIGSVDNIVAFGTVVEVDVEATQQTIHGVPLGEKNARVSVTEAVVANALLPFPIKDEIVRVADAIGTCVAWPRSLVIPPEVVDKEQENRKIVKKKRREMYEDFDHDDLDNLPPKLPLPLKELCHWANIFLKNGVTIHTTLGEEIFGRPRKVAIFRRDVYALTHMKEISNNTIVMYMSCLYQKLQKFKMLHMIAFIDPAQAGALGCGNPTEMARSLSACYAKGKSG